MSGPSLSPTSVAFVATGRSGVGHLRRVSYVADALRRLRPTVRRSLFTNAEPLGLDWLDNGPFDAFVREERSSLARAVNAAEPSIVVVDTATIPGLANVAARRVLILRACHEVSAFELPVPWDHVFVPHPRDEWAPVLPDTFARGVEGVGWIHGDRDPLVDGAASRRARPPRVLVMFGGGGAMARDGEAKARVDAFLASLPRSVEVRTLAGPRARAGESSAGTLLPATEDPRTVATDVDLVVATSGYNSVLELATIQTPVVLVPVTRTHDDQFARARVWAPRLGHLLDDVDTACAWATDVLERRQRRPSVSLPASGATTVARGLLG